MERKLSKYPANSFMGCIFISFLYFNQCDLGKKKKKTNHALFINKHKGKEKDF